MYYKYLKDLKLIQLNTKNLGKKFVNGAWNVAIVWDESYNIDYRYVIKKLNEKGLPTRPFFFPLSSMSTFKKKNLETQNKTSYSISKRGLCLPSGLIITEGEIKHYCSVLKKILKKNKYLIRS